MAIVIYGPAYSTYTRTARLALEEKGLAYRLHEVDTLNVRGRSPNISRVIPGGKFPFWNTTASPCSRRWRSPATWTKASQGRRYSLPMRDNEREWRKSVPCSTTTAGHRW
jgi:Glutathione S-transferase, N-terminal domain